MLSDSGNFEEGYLVPCKFTTGTAALVSDSAHVDDEQYDPARLEHDWTGLANADDLIHRFNGTICRKSS